MEERQSPEPSDGADPSRYDRELIELLNELRVALPGVQVLFAFLLTVPFSQRFADTTDLQRDVYFVTLMAAAASTAFLVTPSAFHRVRFRQADKAYLLKVSNRLALLGLAGLAIAVVCAVFLVSDFLFRSLAATIVTATSAAMFAGLWFVFPLARHLTDGRRGSPGGAVSDGNRRVDPDRTCQTHEGVDMSEKEKLEQERLDAERKAQGDRPETSGDDDRIGPDTPEKLTNAGEM